MSPSPPFTHSALVKGAKETGSKSETPKSPEEKATSFLPKLPSWPHTIVSLGPAGPQVGCKMTEKDRTAPPPSSGDSRGPWEPAVFTLAEKQSKTVSTGAVSGIPAGLLDFWAFGRKQHVRDK